MFHWKWYNGSRESHGVETGEVLIIDNAKLTEEPEKPKVPRTGAQNRAIHVDCHMIAEKLEAAGLDMRVVLKPIYSLPWTTESVKEQLFKPIMKALYGFTSTTELPKGEGKIERIHEVLTRELGERHGVEWHDFPSDEVRQQEILGGHKIKAGETPNGVPDEVYEQDTRTAFDCYQDA